MLPAHRNIALRWNAVAGHDGGHKRLAAPRPIHNCTQLRFARGGKGADIRAIADEVFFVRCARDEDSSALD